MEKFYKGILGLLAVLGLIMGTMAYNKPFPQPVQNETKSQNVGATATLDNVDNPFVKIGGVDFAYKSTPMAATSSEICAMKNPYSGTSTLASFSAEIKTGILGANTFSLSTTSNSTGYGSSTSYFVLDHSIASNGVDSMYWFPTSATTTNARILPGITSTGEGTLTLAPGDWVTYKIATTTGAGTLAAYYQGTCKYVFKKI